MATLNVTQLRRELKTSVRSLENLAYGAALSKFTSAHNEMLEDLEENEISQELRMEENAGNISNTLEGVGGNLYTFIGFVKGDKNPVEKLREVLVKETTIDKRATGVDTEGTEIYYSFKVHLPSDESILDATRMPWGQGSWAYKVEHFIDGISHYIYHRYFAHGISRSTAGLQHKKEVRSGFFQGKPYLTEIFRKFLERIYD